MKLHDIFSLLLAAVLSVLAQTDNGLTTAVRWDEYSIFINGERNFIQSGEFHYERLPVPLLWRDVMEKYKANGLNTISVYFFWSYHSARPGKFDFTSPGKDIQYLFNLAKDVGLWVIARPGPYCNAETNGGGLALWGSDGSLGKLRTSDETYHQAWLPWIQAVGEIIAKNQITNGGPVILYQIENELQETNHDPNDTLVIYMEQIKNASRAAGIVVPFTSNEKGMRSQSWSTDYQDVGGSVNIYGLDSYPGGLSCTNPDTSFNLVRTYYQWFQNYSFTQPSFTPEFEAGWFQPWGGNAYDDCLAEHSPEFADVFYKNNIGQRVTMQNLYMAFGGTNWGNLAAPVVYTSYDYSAPLNERREITDKFKQTKLINFFTRASSDLLKTKMVGNGTGYSTNSSDIWTWHLKNQETSAGFLVLQHNVSSSRAVTNFSINLNTSAGEFTVPSMQLSGRQSKIVVTDYIIANHTLLYSTADVLTWGVFGKRTVIVLYANVGQTSEFAIPSKRALDFNVLKSPHQFNQSSRVPQSSFTNTSASYMAVTYVQPNGSVILEFPSEDLLVYLLNTELAWNFFATSLSEGPAAVPDQQVFVSGPYLVRNATVQGSGGHTLALIGDNINTTDVEIFAGKDIDSVTWNGKSLNTARSDYGLSYFQAKLSGTENRTFDGGRFKAWAADSLPERHRDYDDSNWVLCNKTTTLSPVAPLTLPVLFSSDYGYYAGIKIYRGYFERTEAKSANITVQGGRAAGFTAWLNGMYVGGHPGDPNNSSVSALLDFSNATLFSNTSNVLTILTDYTGHDQTSTGPAGLENPRGILGAWLYTSNHTKIPFTTWKIQGNAGGSSNIDPVRGPMNEDGLYGTRTGWHLPGYRPTGREWTSNITFKNFTGTGVQGAGVTWYILTVETNMPEDLDIPLYFGLKADQSTIASVTLYANGYQYGKFLPHIGPQTDFPIPPGIINTRGKNTFALAVWAMTDAGAKLTDASLYSGNMYETGFGFGRDGSDLQPGWTEDRLQYA